MPECTSAVYLGGIISVFINIADQNPKTTELETISHESGSAPGITEGETEAQRKGHGLSKVTEGAGSRTLNYQGSPWLWSELWARARSMPVKTAARGFPLQGHPLLECTHTEVYSENKGSDLHGTQTSSLGVRETRHFSWEMKFWLSSSAVPEKVLGRH